MINEDAYLLDDSDILSGGSSLEGCLASLSLNPENTTDESDISLEGDLDYEGAQKRLLLMYMVC